MATTVAAVGKIKTLAQRGEPMPEGWMVGRDGKPLTDPNRRDEGFLLPIGGAKGYGLAMAIGLLAGVLNGAAFGSDVVDFTTDTTSPTNTGQFVAAIDIAAFGDPGPVHWPPPPASSPRCAPRPRCPAMIRSACPATGARRRVRHGWRMASPCTPPCLPSWTASQTTLPLRPSRPDCSSTQGR